MLAVARKKAESSGLSSNLTLIKDSITQLRKHAAPNSFDCIVCTMVLGEFSPDYLKYIFEECLELLRTGGRLMIGDEVWPTNAFARAVYRVMLGIAWIPQFLLLRRVNYPVKNLQENIAGAGFKIMHSEHWLFTSFTLISAVKPENISGAEQNLLDACSVQLVQ
jgi:ubiquinone/menaquinone biosynthesis C-methylase UbiE